MIKRLLCIFGVSLLSASFTQAQSSTWIPDKAHSGVDFSILHRVFPRCEVILET